MMGDPAGASPRSDPQFGVGITPVRGQNSKKDPIRLELGASVNTISSLLGRVLTTPTPDQPQFQPAIYIRSEPMKIRPLHDRVIVKRLESETKTAGGIVIPD